MFSPVPVLLARVVSGVNKRRMHRTRPADSPPLIRCMSHRTAAQSEGGGFESSLDRMTPHLACVGAQALRPVPVAQLGHNLAFDLAHPFPRESETLANLI